MKFFLIFTKKQKVKMKLDVLIITAHPDDAELCMGGTIAKFVKNKFSVGIIDLTKGELGSRGNEKTRKLEAEASNKILGVKVRDNLDLPDGNIMVNHENVLKVISKIRKYKPKIVFTSYFNDRHVDHINGSNLVKKAFFMSGLVKVPTNMNSKSQTHYRPMKLYYYMHFYPFEPSFIIDISDTFEAKMNSVKAFKTQFFDPESTEPETFISQPNFLKFVESRAQVYGFRIGKSYGEPFYCEEDIEMNISNLLKI